MSTTQDILVGLTIGLSENKEVMLTAKQFMNDNNYINKEVAINDLQQLDYPEDLKIAVATAIILL